MVYWKLLPNCTSVNFSVRVELLINVMQGLICLQAEKYFHVQDVSHFCDNQRSVTNFKKIYVESK